MGDLLIHPSARRPQPMLKTDPLPDEAVPALAAGDIMEALRVYTAKLAVIYGIEAARHLAHGCIEDGLKGVR